MKRILVVDDEPHMVAMLHANFSARGYLVEVATDGEAALALLSASPHDVMILDLGLPGISGIDVIVAVRTWTDLPIIVLSARDGDDDKIWALDAGADDYVTKPFSIGELLARVRSALRRSVPASNVAVIETIDFTIDLAAHVVTRHGAAVHLTPIEWGLLDILVRNPGKLVTQKQLLQTVWGPTYEQETHYLRVHMTHLRRKLEPDSARPCYFMTEPGLGYRYLPPA